VNEPGIVSGRDEDDGAPDAPIAVELSIGDAELAERVHRLLAEDPGIALTGAGVRITDSAADIEAGMRVIVLAAGRDAGAALRAGAAAVLSRRVRGSALRAAIRAVANGLTVLSDEARDRLVARESDDLGLAEDEALSVELTERESQVLALLADGASNKVIARALGITPHTAKFHVASIIAKLGATGRTDAVAKAMRMGILMI
jgi:DNA-binding NarL/FixJ family response regulator